MKRTFFYETLFILALLLNISACNQNHSSSNNEQNKVAVVRIGSFFTAVDYAPYLVAKNKGLFEEVFKDKGIQVEYTTFQSLPPLNEALATNKIDIIFEAEPPAIVGKAAGIDEKIVDISCSITLGILIPLNSKINSVADLKGKKIALLAGTGVHYGVLKILENNGLEKKDVQIIDMLPPDAKNAFETGKVDAWAVWSPFIDQEELNGKGRVLPDNTFLIQSIMVARGKFLSENPENFNLVKQAFDKAQLWMEKNPAEAQQIVAKELNLKLEEVQKAWGRHNWKAEITPDIIQDIQNKANFLYDEKFIEKQINVQQDLIGTVPTSN